MTTNTKKDNLLSTSPGGGTTASTSGTWAASPARPARAITSDSRELDELFGAPSSSSRSNNYRSQRGTISAASLLAKHIGDDTDGGSGRNSVRTARSVSNLSVPGTNTRPRSSTGSYSSANSIRDRRASSPAYARPSTSRNGDDDGDDRAASSRDLKGKQPSLKRQRLSPPDTAPPDDSTPQESSGEETPTPAVAADAPQLPDREQAKTPKPQPSRGWLAGWYSRDAHQPKESAPARADEDTGAVKDQDSFHSAPSSPTASDTEQPGSVTPRVQSQELSGTVSRRTWWGWGTAVEDQPSSTRDDNQVSVVTPVAPVDDAVSTTSSSLAPPTEPQTITKSQSRSWLSSIWGEPPRPNGEQTPPERSSVDSQSASSLASTAPANEMPPPASIPIHAPKPKSAKYYWPLSSSAASSLDERGRSNLSANAQSALGAAASAVSSRASSRSRDGKLDSPGLAPQSDAPLKPLTGSIRSSPRPRGRIPDPPFENLVLPTFTDTFERPPRSFPHRKGKLTRAVTAVSAYLFAQPPSPTIDGPRKEERPKFDPAAQLPKSLETMHLPSRLDKIKRVTVIGVHGWFPNPKLSTFLGEPTGTSVKFATMMHDAVQSYLESHDSTSFNIQAIALEGDGQVEVRVDKLYKQLCARSEWIDSLKKSDAVFLATHSQGSVVSTLLLAQMLDDGLLVGHKTHLLALCAIAHGPFVYLSQSYALQPYFNYLESAAARELFDFQDPESPVAVKFLSKLQYILAKGVKMTAIGSLNDQVVPLYSALFCGMSHPAILRAVYIDSAAFRQSDFLANLLVFAARLRNAGLSDHDLTYHVSEVLAGALTGVGHSKIYEEEEVFNLAVRYHFETTQLSEAPTWLSSSVPSEPIEIAFRPRERRNPYILTWTLRGIVEDPQVRELFGNELTALREAFESWRPTTKVLKECKLKLEGIRMLPRAAKSVKDGKL